jgi:hypothetical protein
MPEPLSTSDMKTAMIVLVWIMAALTTVVAFNYFDL